MQAVETRAANKAFDISLPQLGPYRAAFSRSGRWLVMGGARGHLALTDWSRMYSACEVQVCEATRDVCVLHNEQFFAAAQRKYVYIYDRRGLEVHCCRGHGEPTALDFLPHHFLLVSTGLNGAAPPADVLSLLRRASALACAAGLTEWQAWKPAPPQCSRRYFMAAAE
jgi:U3 small nucleolar RNA-associated protein 7